MWDDFIEYDWVPLAWPFVYDWPLPVGGPMPKALTSHVVEYKPGVL